MKAKMLKVKEFIKKHKTEILLGTTLALISAECVIIKKQNSTIASLESEKQRLINKQIGLLIEADLKQNERIERLEINNAILSEDIDFWGDIITDTILNIMDSQNLCEIAGNTDISEIGA